ncbi:Amino acid transporter transmembrane [Penicillium waksmanii]|uniref:Amino acid transporter transmembrane n=1 Tax=Penicillium waksmanii TaxID=69791 RepID=UPI002546D0C6|nr:Amino acid transporter transmembrane [Penicillium waksmanii]KAJ5975281.1 Amino acid transporter transmembrane [Penicillium waksmanii]
MEVNTAPPVYQNDKIVERKEESLYEEEGQLKPGEVQDAFGNEENAEIKYKTLKWWQCGLLMICESVSLGVLSLPSAMAILGIVPGVILIIGLGLLATYTGYNIGLFRERYPHIQNLGDAGEILLGKFGRELFGTGQFLFCLFIMGSHILTFRIMMNTVTNHATCSILFSIIGMVISIVLCLPPPPGTIIQATTETTLYTGFQAVSNIVFAYCAHVAFFGLIAEMETPQNFKKSLFMLQGFEICLYLTVAIVVYFYIGTEVTSPAFNSAGPLMSKIAFGIAIPTIIGAGVVNGHIGLKYIYFRICTNMKSDLLHQRNKRSVGLWVGLGISCWTVAWIIAEAIPVFSDLNGLISALFASWFSYGLSGVYWLHLNYGQWTASPRKIALMVLNMAIACFGLILCVLGLYASGTAISANSNSNSFTCKNTDT